MRFRKLGSDDKFDYYLTLIEGRPVKLAQSQLTKEIFFDVNDIKKFLGYVSLEEFLSSDKGLDTISAFKLQHSGFIVTVKSME